MLIRRFLLKNGLQKHSTSKLGDFSPDQWFDEKIPDQPVMNGLQTTADGLETAGV